MSAADGLPRKEEDAGAIPATLTALVESSQVIIASIKRNALGLLLSTINSQPSTFPEGRQI